MSTVLKVQGASKRFGGLQALSEVGITIEELMKREAKM